MKTYDMIAIGTGSAMTLVQAFMEMHSGAKIAVIDKDPPGGICLTKGCVPTKLLAYPAEMIRMVEEASHLGIDFKITNINFAKIMKRMRSEVGSEIKNIQKALKRAHDIDYYPAVAEFIGPYQLRVAGEKITSNLILLGLGSRPSIPAVKNLESIEYHTSDTILDLKKLPKSIAIIGGSYIAAEYGHFFSAMGSEVTIIGRNPRFLPQEETEVGDLALKRMSKHMTILTGHEAVAVSRTGRDANQIIARSNATGKGKKVIADKILVATGREPNTDLLRPERSGIEADGNGWIKTDTYLETSQENIWAFGDGNGKHQFKHVANYESQLVYYNALLKEKIKVDYHAVPHAVFTYPEVAAVGMTEAQAVSKYGAERILIGFQRFENTTKGDAMGVKGYFVKIIVDSHNRKILGAHVIGPQASILIQEVVTLMYTKEQTIVPVIAGMHIHPSLSEVVERAFLALMPRSQYQEMQK
jgi:dihydrolipoamide dehydrogenase